MFLRRHLVEVYPQFDRFWSMESVPKVVFILIRVGALSGVVLYKSILIQVDVLIRNMASCV
jgi:hypothetical protein